MRYVTSLSGVGVAGWDGNGISASSRLSLDGPDESSDSQRQAVKEMVEYVGVRQLRKVR
jgi:hypothetical protein